MSSRRVVITIDGPAGTGKSSVAARLARRLGLSCLDTGAMYRCVSLLALRHGVDPSDGPALVDLVEAHDISFDWTLEPPRVRLDGADVEREIRGDEVAGVVSIVAAVGAVREAMVRAQRAIADAHPRLVSEGRDQGSVVFPDAEVRFFLDADPAERARRRALQVSPDASASEIAAVQQQILARDHLDSTRAVGPLTTPEGAVVVDTTQMTLDEVVDHLEGRVRELVATEVLESC